MDASVEAFRARLQEPWLVERQDEFMALFEQLVANFSPYRSANLISEHPSLAYLANAFASIAVQAPTFLANPDWREPERQLLRELDPAGASPAYAGHIMIATGGTGGRIKFAMHTWETLCAAVAGYAEFFKTPVINGWCTLPLYHVSGFMQAVRSFVTGGRLVFCDYRELWEYPELDRSTYHISLVPTQLRRILAKPDGADWLRGFGLVLIGGAGMPDDLAAQVRDTGPTLSCSYGMTETAAVVAAQTPEDFATGQSLSARLLPHASAQIVDREIVLSGKSLFRGYYPDEPQEIAQYRTGDEGVLDAEGRLSVTGRRDRFINTGGEKVDPRLVEEAIRGVLPEAEAFVCGEADPDWGQCVVALLASASLEELGFVREKLASKLPAYMQPKRWLLVDALPLKSNGKPDHTRLSQMLAEAKP